MFERIQNWWWSRQRAVDMEQLWPACVEHAGDLQVAKMAFMLHASTDPAWARYYGDKLWTVIDSFTREGAPRGKR